MIDMQQIAEIKAFFIAFDYYVYLTQPYPDSKT